MSALSTEAVLPYGGTSGHSGSKTSRLRAVRNDESGETLTVQQTVMQMIAHAGYQGLTVAEARFRFQASGRHHGTVSGALSNLHYEGLIARLEEERGGCEIYVLAEWVDDRPTNPHMRTRKDEAREKRRYRIAAALWAHQFGGNPAMFYRTSETFLDKWLRRADAAIVAYEEVTV